MARVEIACTLSSNEAADRTQEWRDALGLVTERRATESGIRLRLPADPVTVGRVAELVTREADCCAFFSFTLTVEHASVWLDVAAPPDGKPVLDALFA